jgi:bifunctional DNA-binding transcriptional regulator/antitoxin component of YhaV-PrlF toxin-antitoxin module
VPRAVREALGLEAGARFVVLADADTIILKRIHEPSIEEFRRMADKAEARAREAGLEPADVENAVSRARHRNK